MAVYKDPFRPGGNNVLVLCDTYKYNKEPTGELCDKTHTTVLNHMQHTCEYH